MHVCIHVKLYQLEPELMNCTHTHTFIILTLYNQSVYNLKHTNTNKTTHNKTMTFKICHKGVEWYNEIIIIIIIITIFIIQFDISWCGELSTEQTLRVLQTKLLKPLARGVTQETKWAHRKTAYSVGSLRRTCTHTSLHNTYTQAKGSGSAYLLGVLNKEMENLCNDLCVG